ncbi:MAG: nitroreductase family protein [Turicibacter sp.]|nr:nitroreductase family protein [Turicibacter sp.]
MNEVLSTIAGRFSCRKYTGAPIEQEKLKAIAKAGLQSPSALNKQPWEIIVIKDKALIEELDAEGMAYLKANIPGAYERIMSRGGKVLYNAPALFLVLKTPDGDDIAKVDGGILVQTMALAAASLGINSVVAAMTEFAFKGPNAETFKKRVGWEDGYEFVISLIAGYGDMEAAPHEINLDKVKYVG